MRVAKQNAGFSLIEVMVAILILGIALVALTQGITSALTASKESELQTVAALVAAGRIETLRAEGYVVEGGDEGELTGGLALYRWKETVTETDLDGLYEVVVKVEHTGNDQLLFELRTMLFDPPLESATPQVDEPKTTRERLLERSEE